MPSRVWATLGLAACLGPLPASPVAAQSPAEPPCGTYEYAYPYNTERLNENHFIVLDCSGDALRGWYYGTSDDFDPVREGYLPGFFVAPMGDLAVRGDSIHFTIQVPDDELFTRPVPLRYRGADELPRDRYEPWGQVIRAEPRQYQGVVDPDSIVLDVDGRARVFYRGVRHGRCQGS